jgi:hypothetical protein
MIRRSRLRSPVLRIWEARPIGRGSFLSLIREHLICPSRDLPVVHMTYRLRRRFLRFAIDHLHASQVETWLLARRLPGDIGRTAGDAAVRQARSRGRAAQETRGARDWRRFRVLALLRRSAPTVRFRQLANIDQDRTSDRFGGKPVPDGCSRQSKFCRPVKSDVRLWRYH